MIRKLSLIMIAALSLGGCSFYSSQFTDVDGTHYETRLMLAPFSKLDADAAKMLYEWTEDGGSIAVARDVEQLDQTLQIQALDAIITLIIQSAIQAAANSAAGGVTP